MVTKLFPVTATLLLLGAPVVAQSPLSAAPLDAAAAQEAAGERSPVVAGLLQAALPPLPLGYAYVGDLGRGLLPTGLMVGGATLLLVGVVDIVDWTEEDKSAVPIYLGLGALIGGYVFGIVDVIGAAKDRNARARAAPGPVWLLPTARGLEVVARVSTR